MKKILATLLVLAMMLSMLAGCAGETTEVTEATQAAQATQAANATEAADNGEESQELALDAFAGTEITIAVLKYDQDHSTDFSEKIAAKMAEEATGIKVNWITVDQSTKDEKTATLLAGDMPDMIIGLVKADTITSNMSLFYDLSEEGLLETYAPDVYDGYVRNGNVFENITWPDGSICALATGSAQNYGGQARGIYFINKNWLDQLGLDIPNTTEELYEVLCAFRDNDMDGDGDPSNEYPFEFCDTHYASKLLQTANFFGIAAETENQLKMGRMVENGEVVSTFDSQAFKDWLEYANLLATEGLLDVEGFSQSYEQFCGKLANGQVGVFAGWVPGTYMDAELADDYVVLGAVSADGYDYVQTGAYNIYNGGTNCCISANTENVEACLWYWNYLASDMTMIYTEGYGEQGIFWDIDENGKYITKAADEDQIPEGLDADSYKYTLALLGGGIAPLTYTDWCEEYVYVDTTTAGGRGEAVSQTREYLPKDFIPSTTKLVDAEVLEERTYIDTELQAYIGNFIANSVMEGLSDEQWEAHLNQLNLVGYDEWMEWWTNFYNDTF